MSRTIHFTAKTVPGTYSLHGYGPPDGFLPCSGVSGMAMSTSQRSSRAVRIHCHTLEKLTLKCALRSTFYVCSARSGGYRRNDFSRQNKQGFSTSRNRQYEEREGFENFEDSEIFTSKNGPVLTGSGNSKFQATATPGPREKEIVELFRKVQAQLRERASKKEKKTVEEAQGKGKESGTVDSLLKLLRKHSVQQGKKSSNNISSSDFILDQPQPGLFSEDKSTNILGPNSGLKPESQDSEAPVSRPRSVFQRRSPIRQVKTQPIYSDVETGNHVSHTSLNDQKPEPVHVSELEMDSETEIDTEQIFSDEGVLDEISEDETSEIYDTDDDKEEAEEHDQVDSNDLNVMKLPELRALAKSRGVRGFSKLKKCELIELLTGG